MLSRIFGRKAPHRVAITGTDGAPSATIEVGRNKTVLESALEAGLSYPHDCTVGTCGSCRTRLITGKVDAITPFGYTLTREELEAGFILACQAVPLSDLAVEVDLAPADLAPRTFAARLVATDDLTHDIKRVTWEADAPVRYRAGQYMNVSWPGAPGPRSYSFSDAPGVDGKVRITSFIRRVPGGAFTELLFAQDLAEVPFTIEAPHGGFWLRDGAGPLLLIGGGSGLSPLMSVLEHAAAQGVARDTILLFGGRATRDLYCQDDIAAIGARWPARFEFRPVLSEEQADGLRFGLVTGEIPAAIADLGGAAGLQAYLCGPPAMIDAAVAVLTDAGVPLTDIHYDKFTDASTVAR
ncbi:2Fe-2S iron-sulfur cluster-binding protein [Novosphingobium lentum]|uniref:2Fe-2S iron-sulfur cluster-binding protein n=1 Tax=Novosphingobium lentum TaxID=145287 RepID=UPI000833AAAB|nr:2Fe-2S iron-sulfur cluster binding domain-containing protein [Novosphingobium lentum]